MNLPHRTLSKFTNAEFERLVRSGGFADARVELRRGMILKMNAQHIPHAKTKRLLAETIKAALGIAKLGWIVDQEVSVDFGGGFEPLPDIVVWDTAAAPADSDGPVPGNAVRLIVEVANATLSDDLGEKLEDYAAAGLAEYWVADVKGRLILRHAQPSNAAFSRREPSRFGERFPSLTNPALSFDTTALA